MSTPPGWTPDPRERDDEPARPDEPGAAGHPPPSPWDRPSTPPGYGAGSDPAGQPPGFGTGSDPASSPWDRPSTPPGYGAGSDPAGQPPGYGAGSDPASSPWQQPGPGGPGGYPGYPPAGPPPAGYGPPPGHQDYPPPGGGAQPPMRNRKVLALIAGLAVAAIVLVGVAAAVALRGNPRDTADEFMAALQAKDIDKAHSLLCKDGQHKVSKDGLRRDFDLDDRTITSYRLGTERTRQREGKDETLIPVTIDYDKGTEVKLDVGVWNEGGQKVCSLNPPGEA